MFARHRGVVMLRPSDSASNCSTPASDQGDLLPWEDVLPDAIAPSRYQLGHGADSRTEVGAWRAAR